LEELSWHQIRVHPGWTMLRHRYPATFGLLILLMLGPGAFALAHANAEWNVAFNDPAHFDISDVSGVIATTVVYRDAMEDIRRALMVTPRITASLPISSDGASDQTSREAHRPRAPPTARALPRP